MLTDEKLVIIENGVKELQDWLERHKRYETVKVKTTEQASYLELITLLVTEVRTLQQQNKQLIEGMEFYGNEDNWKLPQFGQGHSEVVSDRGNKARDIIKSIQGGAPNGTSNNNV